MAKPAPTPHPGRPGGLLLHPLAVLAVVVLVINDHVLKALVPGLLTGKLSDFAGLLFFPLLAVSAVEIAALGFRRGPPDRQRLVLGSIVATALAFVLVKATSLGTAVFAWSLGTAQWLASAGPIRGDVPQPVTVATDPGDVVALAALVGAMWVARPSRSFRLGKTLCQYTGARRQPSPLAVLMLVIASLASMATGAAVQQLSSATYEEQIHLDASHSTATRHLSFEVDNNDPDVRSIQLSAGISPVEQWLAQKPGITVTLVPDPPAGAIGPLFDLSPPARPALDLTETCLPACQRGATIVVRLGGEAPADGVDVTLNGTLWAVGGSRNATLDTRLSIRNDSELAFMGNPTSRVATSQGTFKLSSAVPTMKKRLEIRVAADALKAPLEYPLVVSITMSAKSRKIKFADVPTATVMIGGMEVPLHEGEPPESVEVRSFCKAAHACEIPIVVRSDYSPTVTIMNPPSIARTGSAELLWAIEVRLEAFDGRQLPAGAVSIQEAKS